MSFPVFVNDLSNPRLIPYRNLRERTLRGESIFIAEGPLVVERLLRSEFEVESVLITRERMQSNPSFLEQVPETVPVWAVDEKAILDEIVGFEFYQGVLALGKRKRLPTFLEGARREAATGKSRSVWVVLCKATKPDNLGLAFRASAALGASAVILDEQSCDPFSRRALRVSMGGVLQVPVWRAVSLADEIQQLQRELTNFDAFATVLDETAESICNIAPWPARTALLFGNEYEGLLPEQTALCRRRVMIPMRPDVDSLNLGVSVGIFLYETITRTSCPAEE